MTIEAQMEAWEDTWDDVEEACRTIHDAIRDAQEDMPWQSWEPALAELAESMRYRNLDRGAQIAGVLAQHASPPDLQAALQALIQCLRALPGITISAQSEMTVEALAAHRIRQMHLDAWKQDAGDDPQPAAAVTSVWLTIFLL